MEQDIKTIREEQPLMVTIWCITYNHEPYIRQCLKGFIMQETNFRFEAIVHDDASTDGTAAIIREYAKKYPNIIKPILETENQYSKHDGTIRRMLNKHTHGKYVAMCEGDDYWTDPLKLQKQVDFLESHPDYSMCYSDIICYNQKQNKFHDWTLSKSDIITTEDLIRYNRVHTLTTLIRNSLLIEYSRFANRLPPFPLGDYPMWLWMSLKNPIYHFKEKTGVYRVLEKSASHLDNPLKQFRFRLAGYDIRLIFIREFNLKHKDYYLHRLKFIVTECLKNRWYKELFLNIFKPRYRLFK
jgi:glycosyltransferase involved in cell wall biosynthesis